MSFPVPAVSALPQPITRLSRARLAGGRLVDVRIKDGVVVDVAPTGTLPVADPAAEVLDLDGWLLLAAPAEPHAHLDKALSFDLVRPPLGDLDSAVASWVGYAPSLTVDSIAERARTQALAMLANGITAIRTHVDIHPGTATRGAQALVRVREELAGLIDLQIVALPHWRAGDAEIAAALDLGLDLVGGAPHHATNPLGEVERMVAFAEKYGLGLDLHTDERLDGPVSLDHYARLVRRLPHDRSYAASHCVRLGTLPPDQRDAVIKEVLRSDLGVIGLPATNLYLQGRQHAAAVPRGLTALRPLIDAGVRVAAGADNVRDPFNPVGRSDAFETASLLVTAGHLAPAEAWHLVTDGARAVMGLPLVGPRVGAQADLLAVPAANLVQAIAEGPADRLVVRRGNLVARSTLSRDMARPDRAFIAERRSLHPLA
ncbi:amidohydrolase family protein [Dactylosporangium sp. CA-092794]|uniref:amidohydrolase family protein n=1 Tax=Dactylosporangium sp. CA-092794 TaxID=3239929 RepID=UPI003D917A1F